MNTYGYANANPINVYDPNGLLGIQDGGIDAALEFITQLAENDGNLACVDFRAVAIAGVSGTFSLNYLARLKRIQRLAGLLKNKFSKVTKGARVPGRVQSRINVSNKGLGDTLRKHADGRPNKSQFSINQNELVDLLGSKKVVGSQARALPSGNFVREVDVGRTIGNLPANAGEAATSKLTVITDKAGNLVNSFPGPLSF